LADLVIDTDVVSFGFRLDSRFVDSYGPAIQGHRAIVSFMTVAELHFGAINGNWGPHRKQGLFEYLRQNYVECYPTEATCEAWGRLVWQSKQQGIVMSGSDAWIAATAIVHSLPLVTHNSKHFQHLSNLNLISFPDQ